MKQLDKNYLWLYFIQAAISCIFIAIIIGFQFSALILSATNENIQLVDLILVSIKYILLVLVFLLIFIFIWSKLHYKYYRYELTDNSFRKEHGVISKSYESIPYDRIQNVNIHRSLMYRIFNISKISIETAGTGVTEGYLPGLSKEEALKLRDEIISLSTKSRAESRNL